MSLLSDLTLASIFSRIFACLSFVAIHGGVFTVMLALLRKVSSGDDERISFNPLDHLSMPALGMAIFFKVTWTRHHPLELAQLKGGRWALVGVWFAMLAASLLVVPLIDLIRPLVATYLPRTLGYSLLQGLVALQDVTLNSVLLTALPLPGLTGGLLLLAAFPHRAEQITRWVVPVQVVLVLGLVAGVVPTWGHLIAPYFTRL
jgi:hypothetical protein